MLPEETVARFHENGFVAGARILDDTVVDQLREELERVIRENDQIEGRKPVLCRNLSGSEASPVWQIVNIWEASDAFADLVKHPVIAEEIAQLTRASELRLWHDQIQYKPAARGGINMWHQDSPLWSNISPMIQVTAWIALDDVDLDNGCMSMVPGSHRWGDRMKYLATWKDYHADVPAVFEGHPVDVRPCPVAKGAVHYHHGLTWHGSHANTSGRPRRAIALHFMPGETRYVAKGTHPMKPFVEVEDGDQLAGSHFPQVWPRS